MEDSTVIEQRKDLTGKDGTTWDSEANCLIYRGGDCCFNTCTYTSDHYHCQSCGIGTGEVSQALAHVRASPACRKDPMVHYSPSSVAMTTDTTNTLYNAIYNGFNAQNSYPTAGFSGYSQIDSFQWHPSMSDKVAICSSQLSPCCSSNGGTFIPVESQLCSPISDLYSKVTPIRDLVSLPAKSSGSTMDSPAWFAAYNPQQIQKAAYKYSDQNPPPQINFILLDPNDQKHQDVGEQSTNLSSSFSGKSDLGGKDVLKDSYCAYTSQPLAGMLSEDALFSLQLQDETLKQAEIQPTSVPQVLLSDVALTNKSTPQSDNIASTSRVESHLTQQHFSHYMSSCGAFPTPLQQQNAHERTAETNHQPSSAASDSDESDIIVEDTGDDLRTHMTESEIFIEDIKCSLLQGVVGGDASEPAKSSEIFRNKTSGGLKHSRKESNQSERGEEPKGQTESQMKSCLSSYHALLKCVICEKSASDGNPGSVFVQMSSQLPLTTSSHTPVLTKLNEVVAIEVTDFLDVNGKFMCQSCFNLVDTVDSLEGKLESLKQDIAAMIKAGSKPLLVNQNQCAKFPVGMIVENQQPLISISPKGKNSAPAACTPNIQDFFQNTLVGNRSNAKPVIHEQEYTLEQANETERKEYLILSGRALSLANSIDKVSLSLSQHHSADFGQVRHQSIPHEENDSLLKISEVSMRPYELSSVHSTSNDRSSISSHIQAYPSGSKNSSLENGEQAVACAGDTRALGLYPQCQKECLESSKANKAEEALLRTCKNDAKVQLSFKEMRETKEMAEKTAFSPILSMDIGQDGEQKPHSRDCIMENCHEILRLERTMQENLRKDSKTEYQLKFACDLCGDLFSTEQFLQDHISLYPKSDSFLCELCGQLYHNQPQLDDHMFHSHFVFQKHCEFCAQKFFHPCTYKLHMESHPGQQAQSLFPSLPTPASGNPIVKQENTGSKTLLHTCNKCNQAFQMRSHLEHHIKATHVLKKALSKCDECEKTFIKPSDLQAHKRSHSNDKRFECTVCGRRYKSVGNLNHHAKSHGEQKPYTCGICSQGFIRKDFYETHLNSHQDNKPFKCERCLKSFSSKAYLQVHVKWHLDKLKKVTCPICKKTFSQRLNVHLRSHTGERPHPCEKCPKKFITGSALRKHMKRIHKEDTPVENAFSASDESDHALSDSDDPKSPLSGLE